MHLNNQMSIFQVAWVNNVWTVKEKTNNNYAYGSWILLKIIFLGTLMYLENLIWNN